MTSRTTVSPNSKIEWMRRRSSPSIDASLAATSAMVRISSSVTKGPVFRPFPGRTTLATPMSRFDSQRSGAKWVRNQSMGVSASAARSVCCTAKVLGATSPITKNRKICSTMPSTTPHAPAVPSSRTPMSVATVSCAMSTMSSTTLRVCSGRPSISASRAARRSPSSANAIARMRLIRTNAVSAAAKKIERTKSTTTTARIAQSAPPI